MNSIRQNKSSFPEENQSSESFPFDPLITISPDGNMHDVNENTEILTGLSREKLIGTRFSKYFVEPIKAIEALNKTFEDGAVLDIPLMLKHDKGKITNILFNGTVYRDEEGKILGIFSTLGKVRKKILKTTRRNRILALQE